MATSSTTSRTRNKRKRGDCLCGFYHTGQCVTTKLNDDANPQSNTETVNTSTAASSSTSARNKVDPDSGFVSIKIYADTKIAMRTKGDTVGAITSTLRDELEPPDQKDVLIKVVTEDSTRLSKAMNFLDAAKAYGLLKVHVGCFITNIKVEPSKVGAHTSSEPENEAELTTDEDEKVKTGERVSTVKQVIALLNQIHSMKCEGLSVWAVLRKLQKDRKTIDRFKHIYYLQNLDAERLKQMEAQWKGNNFKGGLAGLDARTKESFTKEDKAKLEDLADQNKITIFGKL